MRLETLPVHSQVIVCTADGVKDHSNAKAWSSEPWVFFVQDRDDGKITGYSTRYVIWAEVKPGHHYS